MIIKNQCGGNQDAMLKKPPVTWSMSSAHTGLKFLGYVTIKQDHQFSFHKLLKTMFIEVPKTSTLTVSLCIPLQLYSQCPGLLVYF